MVLVWLLFWFGFFFDIVGVIIVACLSDVKRENQIRNDIRELKEESQRRSSVVYESWFCPNCGTKNPGDSKFCKECGEKSFIYQNEWTCKKCGHKNPLNAKFCGGCGSKREVSDDLHCQSESSSNNEDELIKEFDWDKVGIMRSFFEYTDEYGKTKKIPFHKKVHILNISKDAMGEKYDIEFIENGHLVYVDGVPSYYIIIDQNN